MNKYSLDSLLLAAIKFASEKHMLQRRKGCENIPYINHTIKVAYILQETGGEKNAELLAAAVLHDVLEDTETTEHEIISLFGENVCHIVKEVTDDMSLTYDDRKRMQIKKAPTLSNEAKKIKIADKISNINDIVTTPLNWSNRRKRKYVEWSQQVINGCRGINPLLDSAFDEIVESANKLLSAEKEN
ncbi:MAG: HD domain-containing protein [Bacteroidetes bacterium]|nr:HD domain-containing protein [Bacteroidota bacterium]